MTCLPLNSREFINTYHRFLIWILPEQQAGADGTLKAGMAASFVTSPHYPQKYFSNSKLSWIITAPRYSIITLEVRLLLTHLPSLYLSITVSNVLFMAPIIKMIINFKRTLGGKFWKRIWRFDPVLRAFSFITHRLSGSSRRQRVPSSYLFITVSNILFMALWIKMIVKFLNFRAKCLIRMRHFDPVLRVLITHWLSGSSRRKPIRGQGLKKRKKCR